MAADRGAKPEKSVGIYDRPARADRRRTLMIAIAAIVIVVAVLMLLVPRFARGATQVALTRAGALEQVSASAPASVRIAGETGRATSTPPPGVDP